MEHWAGMATNDIQLVFLAADAWLDTHADPSPMREAMQRLKRSARAEWERRNSLAVAPCGL